VGAGNELWGKKKKTPSDLGRAGREVFNTGIRDQAITFLRKKVPGIEGGEVKAPRKGGPKQEKVILTLVKKRKRPTYGGKKIYSGAQEGRRKRRRRKAFTEDSAGLGGGERKTGQVKEKLATKRRHRKEKSIQTRYRRE